MVLAADSQGTHDGLKRPAQKLFRTNWGLVWGTAGPLAGAQTLYPILEKLDLESNPQREDAKAAIASAMKMAGGRLIQPSQSGQEWFEGLFAWFDGREQRHYLLLARQDGHLEFMAPYGAIGSSKQLGEFGFSRSAFMDYKTLQLEGTKMLAHMVAADAVEASARGVDGPIQMAVVSQGEATILREDELRLVRDTVAGFQMKQLDFLERVDAPKDEGNEESGIVPGMRGG